MFTHTWYDNPMNNSMHKKSPLEQLLIKLPISQYEKRV